MSLSVQLLGRPALEGSPAGEHPFRSRKSWGVLAYLLLTERPPSRAHLASLFFAEADDPRGTLRWALAELRRGLGSGADVFGDPVVLRLPSDSVVDVDVIQRGRWVEAVDVPSLGDGLLEGMTFPGSAAFETWLLSEQRHLSAATEAILHEAALGFSARGEVTAAIRYAARATAISPLDENNQALLIRLYRRAGDDIAADAQLAACIELFDRELGVEPGPAVRDAMRERSRDHDDVDDLTTIRALIEAGSAAASAGAVDAGLTSLRDAARRAGRAGASSLRVSSRLALSEVLIHSLGGLDEEGSVLLFEVDEIASAAGMVSAASDARAELGYVDFLRARYDRATRWLTDAMDSAPGDTAILAKASTYLGSVASDQADYPRAESLLQEAVLLSRAAADPRREAFALSMLGRLSLILDETDAAADYCDASILLAERDRWLAFLPWPQALRGEVQLARHDADGAAEILEQAFARACRIGDPCWEGMSARGLALVAEAQGDTELAFAKLLDARTRSRRLADPYVWLDAHILDALCELGRRHRHPETAVWIEAMQDLTSRTGMRELSARALHHGAEAGRPSEALAARALAAGIESEPLRRLVAARPA
jgi:DNA-binding SARP family transcriptional activator